MIKKRIMDEEKENDYERKKLNPYANSTSENNKEKENNSCKFY
jgi:hypothetical protein